MHQFLFKTISTTLFSQFILTALRKGTKFFFVPFLFCSGVIAQSLSYDTLYENAKKSLFKNDYTQSIEDFASCLKEAQRLNDSFKIGDSYIGTGISYDKSGDFENALVNYFKALQAYEAVKNIEKEAGTLKNIGNSYRSIKSYTKASEFFQQALKKRAQLKDSAGLSNVINDMGLLYMDQLQHDTAIAYFTQVISLYKKHASPSVKAFALNNLGLAYSRKENYAKSYQYYTASLQAMETLANDYGSAMVLNNIGNLSNRQKQYKDGLDYSNRGLTLAEEIGSKELVASAYENIAQAYTQLAEYKKANEYLDKLLVIRDSIFKEESAMSYAEMESRYQNEKKQKEIILLKKDNAIKDLDLTNQRRTRTLLLVTLLFIVAITIAIYKNYTVKQKLNTQLHVVNEKLSEANESKIKLFSIITHDLRTPVSSLFNFLHLQKSSPGRLSTEQQEKYNRQINDAAENVLNTMEDLLIWSKSQMEKFEPVTELVNLDDFCNEILNLNTPVAAHKNISLVKHCSTKIYLKTDPNFLKISVRNLVGNAIKFTPENGTVRLIAEQQNGITTITVSDTGNGIDKENLATLFEWNNIRSQSTGLGLRLAREFTEKLHGSISVHSVTGQGTSFVLTFPTATDNT